MRKVFFAALCIPLVIVAMTRKESPQKADDLMKKLSAIPDSVYQDVAKEDLLLDEVYVKLARDGWSSDEIKAIMGDYIKQNRSKVKGSMEYGRYAKQWLPTFGYMPGGDTIYQFVDTTYSEAMFKAALKASPRNSELPYDNYYLSEDYSPEPRKSGTRQPGVFRASKPKPSSGRIHWIQVHPEDPDKIMVVPDGSGIYRTDDCGKHWDLITDRIPDRQYRNYVTHSAIPVDPDNWDHVFAFMGGGGNPVYHTKDGGQTWTRVQGATHHGFKRGHAFRDAEGNLKFIGAVQRGGSSYWTSDLWISEDSCRTWTRVDVPEELLDVRDDSGLKGLWFQEIAFDPTDRNKIYMPTSKSILYFDDGAKSEIVNGKRVYHIKKMSFKVFNQDSTELRCEGVNFPFNATTQSFLNVNPNNPLEMWFACASRNVSYGNHTALYRSRDGGKTWITLRESISGIGSGAIFGNESPWGWLGGFGVNYIDQNWIYGCSMSSAISSDGGKNFWEYAWGNRMTSLQDDGNYYSVSNARHNADNHCIVSHKSGRVFRGSDAGLLMRDKNVKNNEWVNISGDMGQQLFYSIHTNEFGDQLMLGNTQDVDVQTYYEGRWGHWRGYEGTFAMVNPYSSMCYYPSGGGGIDGLDYGSWANAQTKADVCTGNWYVKQGTKLFIVEDFGRTARQVDVKGRYVNMYALSRDPNDGGKSTLWVGTGYNILNYSKDNGQTFSEDLFIDGISNIEQMEADPMHSNLLYIVAKKNNRVYIYKCDMNTKKVVEDLTYNLPAYNKVSRLFYHEGSGDLYYWNDNIGIYLLKNGEKEWKYWVKGFNAAKVKAATMNYTTQEMVIADYGRGVYVADLETPSDRFFDNGFQLKELSHVGNRRTIGIDTKWTIPLYYHYYWTVNGSPVENPSQYLTANLNDGDEVQLRLQLRESPDVETLSAVYTVKKSESETIDLKAGKALYSNGKGRVDLGYVDKFAKDFTLELWVKPETTSGTIIANRQKDADRESKGWWLGIQNGNLMFRYTPRNVFARPTYEAAPRQQFDITGGALPVGKWSHVAVTEEKNGMITLYVNGEKRVASTRELSDYSLNNAVYLSLFADGYEWVPMTGAVDELKMWNYALTEDEVKMAMYSHHSLNENGLVYYNSFNNGTLETDKEVFSKAVPAPRVRAEVTYEDMPVTVAAPYMAMAEVSGRTEFADGDVSLVAVTPNEGTDPGKLWAFGYDTNTWIDGIKSNLNTSYYKFLPKAVILRKFASANDSDLVTLEFPLGNVDVTRQYRLYMADSDKLPTYWSTVGTLTCDQEAGVMRLTDVSLKTILGKRLIIGWLDNGIEMNISDRDSSGRIVLYDETPLLTDVVARTMGNEPEPTQPYGLVTDNIYFKALDKLSFVKNEAKTQFRINPLGFGDFGDETEVTISGEDERLIPMPVTVVNKITMKSIGNHLALNKGGASIGDASLYAPLNRCNTFSIMGWVRIDDATMLTGMRPLLFFRSTQAGATGIHLQDGYIRFHWNEESWSWGTATTLKIEKTDVGRWMHVAMVASPTALDLYLNGQRYRVQRSISKPRIESELMLAKNFAGDTWFTGAFDQVSVWTRSLTQEEVVHYMQNGVKLNDENLLVYANMDYLDDNNQLHDAKSDKLISTNGTAEKNNATTLPFRPVSVEKHEEGVADDKWSVSVNGTEVGGFLSTFDKLPYNYIDYNRSLDMPLLQESYTFLITKYPASQADDVANFVFTHSAVMAGDNLLLKIRPLGSTTPFTDVYAQTATENGKVTFQVPFSQVPQAMEMMVMVEPADGTRPVEAAVSLSDTDKDPNAYILNDQYDNILVNVKIVSGTVTEPLNVVVSETEYASIENGVIEPNTGNALIAVKIDRTHLDKLGWNPLTIGVEGALAEPLRMQVALEPRVRLELDSDEPVVAHERVMTLPVKVEVEQGIMPDDFGLETISDFVTGTNTNAGYLFSNSSVKLPALEFTGTALAEHDGWNLVGNPYAANINMTKPQNMSYDENAMTKFIYQFDPATKTYQAYDMTVYDDKQAILPYTPFFVQALQDNAELTVSPVAKSTELNRKVYSYDVSEEQFAVYVSLLVNGELADRTKLVFDTSASNQFNLNEDALKFWSFDENANQIYTKVYKHDLSINTMLNDECEVPVGLLLSKDAEYSIVIDRVTADYGADMSFIDNEYGMVEQLVEGFRYDFRITNGGRYDDRFVIRLNMSTSGADNVKRGEHLVWAEGGYCHVSGLKGDAMIRVYDVSGREVASERTSAYEWSTPLNDGVFVVKIVENGKEYVAKILVK